MKITENRTQSIFVLIIAFLTFLSPLSLTTQPFENSKIFQTDEEIIIDANLDDWSNIQEIPIDLTPAGDKIDPSADLTVTTRFTFDSENFYAAVKAIDDQFEFPDQSWRYGDGLYLTFIDPYQGNLSDRFYTFGFSLQENEVTKFFVSRDGEYFPEMSIKDIQIQIIPDPQLKSINYEISIPLKYIRPFKPFIHQNWGINLTYIDRDGDKRKILQLYPDTDYDTESSDKRKGAIFDFKVHEPKKHEFQASMNGSHYYHDSEKIITWAINSPLESPDWKINYVLSSAKATVSSIENISLKKGMNSLSFLLEEETLFSGPYDLSLGIIDDREALKYREDIQFFVLNRDEFENLKSKLVDVKKKDIFQTDSRFRESLPTLEIRLEWIEKFMKDASPYADISPISQWHQELDFLFKNVDEGKPALYLPGRIARLAHRSEIDNTLQPYSVFIPLNYDEKTPLPLFVSLHGSGVDEKWTIFNMTRILLFGTATRRPTPRTRELKQFIILAPKARGLSDWYLGDSGKDVIECIDHVKKLYKIDDDNIILDGFSMGGYGAWRLGLLYPYLFKALIIRSGAVSPPKNLPGEDILDLLDKAEIERMNIFIVHGDKDNAVPVENARMAAQKLEKLGIKFNYLEVKGAAHERYNKWEEIFSWLKKIIGK